MQIGFTHNNSVIHRLNPSLKFIAFVVIIVMIFLPLGFFAQLIIGILLITLYIASKLSFKKFWNILKSVIFLFLVLLLINWVIYKAPIAVYVPNGYFKISVGNPNLFQFQGLNPVDTLNDGNKIGTSYVSSLIGGNIIGYLNPIDGFSINGQHLTINDVLQSTPNYSLDDATRLFNSLSVNAQQQVLSICNGNLGLAQNYHWILNNGFVYMNQKYVIQVLSNTNNGIANIHSAVIYQSNWYTLSPRAFQLALYVAIKVLLMILVATILTSTTSSIELAYALEDILSPLKIFRFPVVEASMMIAIALRFVPSLLSESQRILNAQSSRGIDFKNGTIKDKFKSMASLVVPLFNIAFIKSGELANAMEARAYSTRHARTRYRSFKLRFLDWFSYGVLCLITGFLIGIMIKPLLFTPFGLFELGILLG